MAALGKAFKKVAGSPAVRRFVKRASDAAHGAADKVMTKLGVGAASRARNRVHRALCSVTGHPVDVATGKVITFACDLELPGPIPFALDRVWYSTSIYEGPLGRGWHHRYDLALVEESDVVGVRLSDGRAVVFPRVGLGEREYDAREKVALARDARGYVFETSYLESLRFAPVGRPDGVQALVSIEDLSGNRIEFGYDRIGRLSEIVDSSGRRIAVECDQAGRIVALITPHPTLKHQELTVARYDYSREGDLVAVSDPSGSRIRYEYANHLLSKETYADGVSFYFKYDGLDEHAWCTRTWGDGLIFNHRMDYDRERGVTTVANSLGAETIYQWDGEGVVHTEIDPLGHRRVRVFDPHYNVLSETRGDEESFSYQYDDHSNLIERVDPDGRRLAFSYNELGLATAMIAPDGAAWRRTFDDRGRLTGTNGPDGQGYSYSYNSHGLLTRVVTPLGGTIAVEYDHDRMPAAEIDPRGHRTSFAHDTLGRLIRVTLSDGNTFGLDRDLCGRLRTLHRPDGTERQFRYDPRGSLATFRNEEGYVWEFEHSPTGRLTRRKGPDGAAFRWDYDAEGRIVSIEDSMQRSIHLERDPLGRVTSQSDLAGRETRYHYDGLGDSGRLLDGSGEGPHLEFGPQGQVVALRDPRGAETRYQYDWRGCVTLAEDEYARVEFRYDELGGLVGEEVRIKDPAGVPRPVTTISSRYDAEGRRVERRSDFGIDVGYAFNANHWVVGVLVGGTERISLKRDELGRVTEQVLPGGIRMSLAYDALGRLVRQVASGTTSYRRSYEISQGGEVVAVRHDGIDQVAVVCNASGRPIEVKQPGGRVVIPRDSCGRPLRSPRGDVCTYGPDGRLESHGDELRRYDAHGLLVGRRRRGEETTYEYGLFCKACG